MLDLFAIFTRGGALLWTLQFTAMRHSPVEALNALIKSCLLEERSGDNTFTYVPKQGAHQALKWTFHNGLGLVFVAVYQKALSLMYVDELLATIKGEFSTSYYKPNIMLYPHFTDTFNRIYKDCEAKAERLRSVAKKLPQAAVKSKDAKPAGQPAARSLAADTGTGAGGAASSDGEEEADAAARGNLPADDGTGEESGPGAFDLSRLPKGMKGGGGRGRGGKAPSAPAPPVKKEEEKKKEGSKKKARTWGLRGDDGPSKLDFSDMADMSEYMAGSESDRQGGYSDVDGSLRGSNTIALGVSRMDVEEEVEDDVLQGLEDEQTLNNAAAGSKDGPAKRGLLGSFMSSLALRVVGKQSLAAEDLAPALQDMKRKLMERNVAEEIAQNICDSVGRSLEGKQLASFTGVGTFVARAFEEALSGILHKRTVDMLLDIRKEQARGRPYVVVFCGVNGVGKSTNLAKIAYWLGQHGIKVLIAACDTFRAGAVEQLKTHCTRLQVPLYERGYEKDPAKVAAEAIKQAEREGRHVVLVDTAGRMQDNEPLMRALSNLINVNNPNLVLFVGEALVGNDAVDQLVKFNRALYDLAPPTATRRHAIDGIVMTKFDTIDDKVGAAVSMVYASGAPIMFLGCGQTYADLKKLNVKAVVNALLK